MSLYTNESPGIRIQPTPDSFPGGGSACSLADVDREFHQSLLRLQRDRESSCLIVSVPRVAEGHLRTRLLSHAIFKSSRKTRGLNVNSRVAYPILMGSPYSPTDLLAEIYESLVWAPAPKLPEETLLRLVRQVLSSQETLCLVIGQFEEALVGHNAKSRRRIFEILAELMMPPDGAQPINLVLTGGPALTRNLPQEAELLPRTIVMPIDINAAAELAPQL